jgi:predicted HTH domain antitoxin
MAILYLILRRRVRKEFNGKVFLEEIEREVGTIITEMNQTTERNIQLIEHKLASLKNLSKQTELLLTRGREEIEERQIKLDQYRNMGRRFNMASPVSDSIEREYQDKSKEVGVEERGIAEVRVDPPIKSTSETIHSNKLNNTNPGPPAKKSSPTTDNFTHSESRETRKTQVLTLYHQGNEPHTIAEATGFTLGEVELIIALMRR